MSKKFISLFSPNSEIQDIDLDPNEIAVIEAMVLEGSGEWTKITMRSGYSVDVSNSLDDVRKLRFKHG